MLPDGSWRLGEGRRERSPLPRKYIRRPRPFLRAGGACGYCLRSFVFQQESGLEELSGDGIGR